MNRNFKLLLGKTWACTCRCLFSF